MSTRTSELKGILALLLVIAVLGAIFAGTTGKLEQWFGVTWFSGPRALDKIVFVSDSSGSNEIYIANPDGSRAKRLTTDARVLSPPAVSPAGNRIAFVGGVGKTSQVFSVGVDGGSLEQLTSATGPKKQPAYAPDGRLSFIASGKVYVADPNGDSPDVILPTEKEEHGAMVARGETPAYTKYAWGPDGGVAGVTTDQNGSDVLVYLPEPGRDAVRLPLSDRERVRIVGLAWAREDPLLAISAAVGKTSALLVFDIERKSLAPVAVIRDGTWGKPSLSPDRSELVVPLKPLSKKGQAAMIKFDLGSGRGAILVPGDFENPAYSPDGDRVLAESMSEDGKTRNLVRIDASDGELSRVTTRGGFDAVWTPTAEK